MAIDIHDGIIDTTGFAPAGCIDAITDTIGETTTATMPAADMAMAGTPTTIEKSPSGGLRV